MSRRTRSALAAITAAAAMAIAVNTASANQIEITEAHMFRAVWTSLEFSTSSGTVRCPVTLLGYFNSSTMGKTSGATVAEAVNAIPEARCTGGSITVLGETLPWHLNYASFTGTLPNITGLSMTVPNAGIRGTIAGLTCLTATEASHPGRLTYGRVREGELTELTAAGSIPLRGGFFCEAAGEATLSGRASVTFPDETSKISAILETRQATNNTLIMDPDTAILPPGQRRITVVLRNRDMTHDATISRVGFGLRGNAAAFAFIERQCEVAPNNVLRSNRANGCNITIEYAVAENLRPRACEISITYTINNMPRAQTYGVIARL